MRTTSEKDLLGRMIGAVIEKSISRLVTSVNEYRLRDKTDLVEFEKMARFVESELSEMESILVASDMIVERYDS